MNDEHHSTDFASLEPPLQAAIQAALAGPIPEDAIERVKTRAKQIAVPSVGPSRSSAHDQPGRRSSRFLIVGVSVAATLLALVTAGFLLLDYSGGRAFAQMVDKVKAARSVRFTTVTRFGRRPEQTGRMYLEDNLMRIEQFDGKLIEVADLKRKQALLLDMERKLAQQIRIGTGAGEELVNPIEQLRGATAEHAEQIGQEILAGRRTQVYRLHQVDLLGIKGRGEMLVWVDVACGLPAKIVIRDRDPKSPTEFRFEAFDWNEPLDLNLFSVSIPDGFQIGVVAKMPSPREPTESSVAPAGNASYPIDGILSRDRVPAHVLWGPRGETITALLRDPESTQGAERRENELRQWDVRTGKLRWSTKVRGAGWLAGAADGKTLAIVIGYEVQVRDAASGKITRKWAADEDLSPLAFSPDGKTLAAGITEWGRYGGRGGKESGGVQFWDIERAGLLRSIPGDEPTMFLQYTPDGNHLATAPKRDSIKLWDVTTGELTRIFPGYFKFSFSPDGKTIACIPMDRPDDKMIGKINVHDVRSGTLVRSFTSEKGRSASWLTCVAFSPDGRLLAASDWNGTVTLWNVASGAREKTITDHQAGVLAVAFAPDGATLATGSEDRQLRLWKLR